MSIVFENNDRRFRKFFENNLAVMLIIDPEIHRIVAANNAAEKFYGWKRSEIETMRIDDINTLSPTEMKAEIEKARQTERIFFRFKHRLASGEVRNVQVYSSKVEIDGKDYLHSIIYDISEQKNAIEQTESLNLLNNLATQVPGVVYQYRLYPDGRSTFPYSSSGMWDIYEFTPEEVQEDASPLFTRIHPDDYDYIVETINESAKNQTIYESEFRVILPKQGLRWNRCNAKPELLEDGSTLWHGIITDVTERRKDTDALSHSRDLMKYIIKHDQSAVSIFDKDLNYVYVSERYLNDYRVKEKDVIGKHHYEVFPEIPEKWREVHRRVLAGEVLRSEEDYFVRPDDSVDWTRWECRPWYEADGSIGGIVIYTEVINERKHKELELLKLNKRLEVLVESVQNLAAAQSLEQVREIVAKSARKLIGADGATLVFRENDHCFYFDEDAIQPLWKGKRFPMNSCISGWVMQNNKSVAIEDVFSDERIPEGIYRPTFVKSLAMVPVTIKKPIGAIGNYWKEAYTPSETEMQSLQTLADSVGRAIENIQLNEELRKLSRAVTQSPGSIIITDKDGKIDYVNPKFVQLTGYEKDEVLGKNPRILNSGEQTKSYYKELWDTILAGNDWYGDFRNKKKNGELYWESTSISPLTNDEGNITHFVAVKEDITERKRFIEDLKIAKEKAEESDRLKTAFLQNISHEIRTPMNAIMGFSGFLNDPDLIPEKRKQYTDIIVQSSDQLLAIIEDIISIASIEAKQEKIQENEINLNLICNLIYEQFFPRANEKHVTLRLKTVLADDEANIITDATKLTQILTNLINNAVKFTQQGTINFGYRVKEDQLEFYVEDTGIGIPVDLQEIIFIRFRQAETSAARDFGGSGLGLSISKAYVELLGGKIWVSSELGKGSQFYFTIPYKDAHPEKFSDIRSIKGLNFEFDTTKTLLIAEDEESNFMLLKELLLDFELNIIRAENGLEAVELCKSNPHIDLVLMDIKMPEMNGYEATKQIKKVRPDLSIIAQTAYITEADMNKALACGCSDFISKPIDKNLLLLKINEQLHK